MKQVFLCLILAFCLVGCKKECDCEEVFEGTQEQEQEEERSTENQPEYPWAWSPVNHVYVSETTSETSPNEDKFWAYVLTFDTKSSAILYETPNKDYTLHPDYKRTSERMVYEIDYPQITFYDPTKTYSSELEFFDTTLLKSNQREYMIVNH